MSSSFFSGFRSIFLWCITGLVTLAIAPLSLLFSYLKLPDIAFFWGRTWARILQGINGTRLDIQGQDLLSSSPTIYLCNHRSLYDVLVLFSVIPFPFRWMAKESLFHIPVFGKALKGAGHIPVIREDRMRSRESLYQASRALEKGESIMIFPEGTRGMKEGQLLPFKGGAFLLARKAGVRIQPILLSGTAGIIPPRQKGMWIQRIYRGTVYVRFLNPVDPESMNHRKTTDLAESVKQRMQEALTTLAN